MYLQALGTTEILWGAPPAFSYNLKDGMAPGVPITYAFEVPANGFRTTAKGKLVKIPNPNRTGTITCTFDTATEVYDQLMKAIPFELVGLFSVYEAASKRRYSFNNATIITDPDGGFGTDAATVQLMWRFESLTFKPAPDNPANLLGT